MKSKITNEIKLLMNLIKDTRKFNVIFKIMIIINNNHSEVNKPINDQR